MIRIAEYIDEWDRNFPELTDAEPWAAVGQLGDVVLRRIASLSSEYSIRGDIAIHKTATVEEGVILKGPVIISENCFVGAHAYLRGGVFMAPGSVAGPGSEIKTAYLMPRAALAHFNFAGDSVIGSSVNMEAGSVIANHYNERHDKTIFVLVDGKKQPIQSTKFGALVGDHSKIGANAVLSPGSILPRGSVVARLQLVDQCR